MKKYITYAIDSGLVIGFMETTDHVEIVDGIFAVEDSFDFDPSRTYVFDTTSKTVMPTPEKPSFHHEWDWATKSWLPNLDAAITSRKNAIDQERDRRINSSLTYNGKNLDADARARENLKSKLEEIKSREALSLPMPTSMLVWRDADNVTHSWPTQEAYKAWLEGFTVAMSERGTMIYAAAWQHKANIASLTTIEDIMNYNVEEGWNG